MVSFLPIRSHTNDHHHHINSAIQSETSSNNLDVCLHSSDGSIISTNKNLLSLFSPFLISLLKSTQTPACLPTCIILPDFSTVSICDLVSLLGGGVGINKFPRSNYVHAVRDVIEVANLLEITPGQLLAEAVGLEEAGTSSPETIDQQINATIADENQFRVELPPLFELSHAYVENELALLEHNSDKLNHQKISDNLDISKEPFSENLQVPDCDVIPPTNNVVLANDDVNRYEIQYGNSEHSQIFQHSSNDTSKINQPDSDVGVIIENHHSDENTLSGQHPDVIGKQQIDKDNISNNNLDGETRSHQYFGDSHTLLSDLYLSDSYDDSGNNEGFEENLPFPVVLNNDTTIHDGRLLNEEEEMKEVSRMEEENGHKNIKNNEHDIDKATINSSEQDKDAYQETRTNQGEADETTKNYEYNSGKTLTKQHNRELKLKTKSSERPTNLEEYHNYIVNISFLQCNVCGELKNSRRKCPSCYQKIKEASVLVDFDNDKDDNICRDINMNVSVSDNNCITNHSDSNTKKKLIKKDNLAGECNLQSERVRTTSKRSRSFSQNREKEKKNVKKRKGSSKEVIKNKIDCPPKYSAKKEIKEDETAAKDLIHYGARKHPCKKCSNCIQKDCGVCKYCIDKPKFGGPNKKRQKCKKKLKCSQPVGSFFTVCEADKSGKDKPNTSDQPGKLKSSRRRGMPCGYEHFF